MEVSESIRKEIDEVYIVKGQYESKLVTQAKVLQHINKHKIQRYLSDDDGNIMTDREMQLINDLMSNLGNGNYEGEPSQRLLAKITDYQVEPSLLGALEALELDAKNQGKLPSIMEKYKNLKRLTKLPGLHSKDKKFPSKEAEAPFMKYFDGEFAALAVVNDDTFSLCVYDASVVNDTDGESCEKGAKASSRMYPPDMNDDKFFVMSTMCKTFNIIPGAVESTDINYKYGESCTKLKESIPHEQLLTLFYRILHRFYRSYAAWLPYYFRNFVYGHLQSVYAKNEWWDELLDISICWADSCIVTKNGGFTAVKCVRVGEALEAKGKFIVAASLYEEISLGIETGVLTDENCNATTVLGLAALAHKRAGNYELAEAAYVKTLWHDRNVRSGGVTTSWDLNGGDTSSTLANFTLLASRGRGEPDIEYGIFLLGLLVCGGYKIPPQVLRKYPQGYDLVQLVKSKFRSPKQAKKLLSKATETASVSNFRATINSCIDTTKQYGHMNGQDNRTSKEKKKASKVQAREFCSNKATGGFKYLHIIRCDNPGCNEQLSDSGKMFCPCLTTRYCSKDCQKLHWKGKRY